MYSLLVGHVIMGSVDGNRIWAKDIAFSELTSAAWNNDDSCILAGNKQGKLALLDVEGNVLVRYIVTFSLIRKRKP